MTRTGPGRPIGLDPPPRARSRKGRERKVAAGVASAERATDPGPAGGAAAEFGQSLFGLLRTNADAGLAFWGALTNAPSLGEAWRDQSRIAADAIRHNAEQMKAVLDAAARLAGETSAKPAGGESDP